MFEKKVWLILAVVSVGKEMGITGKLNRIVWVQEIDWHDSRCDQNSKPTSDGKVGDKGKIPEIMR